MAGKTLVVIGGGAAGFFCAINAARLEPKMKVILLEKSNKLLSKVRISGGGRCNVTHSCFEVPLMSKKYPRGSNFVKKTFHQFFTTDTIEWFRERGVTLKTESDGRMFPNTDSSETIIQCLLKEAAKFQVEIRMNSEVKKLEKKDKHWIVSLGNGTQLESENVCIACGGYPKTVMFEWLKELGHTISEPVPSLFTFNLPGNPITQLMGVVVDGAKIRIAGTNLVEQGPVLVTHWGLSGPAILRLSAWGARELASRNYQFEVSINWLERMDLNEPKLRELLQQFRNIHASKRIHSQNIGELPQRLWQFLLEQSGISNELRFGDLPKKLENELVKNLVNYTVSIRGKTTFKEEFVTAGGIALAEVDANTMMSKKAPGIYFAGEILDVDGITGGFNFQHAWTSGWIAAKAISER